MQIDVFTSTGTKKSALTLPESVFGAKVNPGLMHLAIVRQQSNRRRPIAHVKHRGEVVGSTKKMFQQKGTGNARRGPIRSPLLRGGGKAFGPRNEANFMKGMPKMMRRAALKSCLSLKAKEGVIIALENYPDDIKTKTLTALLKKLPVTVGRRIVLVTPGRHRALELSARNVPGVKTLFAQYLNPEDILLAWNIIFLVDAIKVTEETFGKAETDKRRATSDQRPAKSEKANRSPLIANRSATASKKPPTQ